MKTKIYLLALLTFHCACNAGNTDIKYNDWAKSNLKGKIKSVRESYYRAEKQPGNTEKSFESRGGFETVFNTQGYKISYTAHESDGRISSKSLYKYDDKNNLIEEEKYYGDELSFRELYTYNDKGNLIEKTTLDPDGKLTLRQLYKNNDRGNIIEERHHNNEDVFYNKIVFEYDERNNLTEENHYDADDLHCRKTKYKYDDTGNRIEEDFHSLLDDTFDYNTQFQYDTKGNVIERLDPLDKSGRLLYEYEFDKTGNWIRSTTLKNGAKLSMIEREIKYFD